MIWEKFNSTKNFIIRHAAWFAVGLAAWLLLWPGIEEIRTILFLALIEAIALAFSGLALFVYTRIPFTKLIMEGDDGQRSIMERHGIMNILGFIFLGVHLLMGLVVLGVYIAQFGK